MVLIINPIMKTNNNFLKSIVYLALVFFAFSCEKLPEPEPVTQEPVMPPLTHTGANTFGCYIDGELFVANEGASVWSIPAVSGSFDEGTKRLVLQGTRNNNDNLSDYMVILVNNIEEPGNYMFDIKFDHVKGYTQKSEESLVYYHDIGNKGSCTITHLDESNNIISGIFNMILVNPDYDNRSSIIVTDGRFDFRY